MNVYLIFYLIFSLSSLSIKGEDLEDFPLDFDEDRQPGASTGETQSDREINKLGGSSSLHTLEQQRNDVMKRVVASAMNKPGTKLRLSQVMPILRTMSGPQRLALAALVSAQVMASPKEPLPPPVDPSHNVTSELMLPISQDIATMFRGLGREDTARSSEFRPPVEVQQRSRQSYNTINNNVAPNRREGHVPNEILAPPPPPHQTRHPSRSQVLQRQNHAQGQSQVQGQTPPNRSLNSVEPTSDDCEFFTSSLCLEDTNYPKSDIQKSLRNSQNKEAFSSLLQDAKFDNIKELDSSINDQIERRQGDTSMIDNSKMCSSRVEMAKPKRARTTAGNWKYVVNTGDYSQSLRLEMCLRPQAPCSYIAPGVRSECMQVYNYHRLLTWDQNTGLAMDAFKVPTCCSCHIQNNFMGQSSRPPMSAVPSGLPSMFPDSGPENNFITSELMSQAMQRLPPGVLQGMRLRGDMLAHHNIPKRESNSPSSSAGGPRRPQGTVIHRGPPLPLQEESEPPPRYPPYHNNVRRTSLRNQTERPDYGRQKLRAGIPLTPNQRHPELPADNIVAPPVTSPVGPPVTSPVAPPVTSPTMTVAPSRRINYSYHPIIDFFKTATVATSEERSMDRADWRPVTEALLMHNKKQNE